jgi:hypothetical protein
MNSKQLLSLAALSRRLDVPYSTAIRMMRKGLIRPDCIAGNVAFFAEARLEDLDKAISSHLLKRPGNHRLKGVL